MWQPQCPPHSLNPCSLSHVHGKPFGPTEGCCLAPRDQPCLWLMHLRCFLPWGGGSALLTRHCGVVFSALTANCARQLSCRKQLCCRNSTTCLFSTCPSSNLCSCVETGPAVVMEQDTHVGCIVHLHTAEQQLVVERQCIASSQCIHFSH
jgi:hypothetical protein